MSEELKLVSFDTLHGYVLEEEVNVYLRNGYKFHSALSNAHGLLTFILVKSEENIKASQQNTEVRRGTAKGKVIK